MNYKQLCLIAAMTALTPLDTDDAYMAGFYMATQVPPADLAAIVAELESRQPSIKQSAAAAISELSSAKV